MNAHGTSHNGHRDKPDIQASLVQAAFARDDTRIGIKRFENGELDYLYERGTILVREAYVNQVGRLVGGERREGLIAGVAVWSIPEQPETPQGPEGPQRPEPGDEDSADQPERDEDETEVTRTLDLIDRHLGVGVATPNHVVSISPVAMCPATEPDEVLAGVGPEPGICPGHHGNGVFIQVIDTGLLADAHTHPWLAGVTGQADQFPAPTILPYTGHGTFVAGVARCMAPAADVNVARVLHHAGAQLEHELVRQLSRALSRSPDIISLSAGATSRKDVPPLGFEALWRRYRHHKGVLLVAAAGNNGDRRPFWPAAFPQVVSVGALSASWRSRASFSDHGGWVDVYAPGEDLINAFATGVYTCHEPPNTGRQRQFHGMARWSGTSFSTPLVSGLVAARMSRTGENSRQAADALLAMARAQALPGVGAVLHPCDFREDDRCAGCGHGGHHSAHQCDHSSCGHRRHCG